MAQYGIQLKQAERAWLVETNELRRGGAAFCDERKSRHRARLHTQTLPSLHEKQLTWWDTVMIKTFDFIGILLIIAIFISLVIAVIRWYQKKKVVHKYVLVISNVCK